MAGAGPSPSGSRTRRRRHRRGTEITVVRRFRRTTIRTVSLISCSITFGIFSFGVFELCNIDILIIRFR